MQVTDEQLEIIESIATMLAPYFTFGYYDREDIEQEIRLMCLDALGRFDESKGASLRTFLIVHSKNRLITLKRDKLCRIFPPCGSCKDWNKIDDSCMRHTTKNECVDYVRWNRATSDKHSLFALSEISEDDMYYDFNIIEELFNRELLDYIDENIPAKYRQDYLNYIENGKIKNYAKQNIVRIIKDLAKDYVN